MVKLAACGPSTTPQSPPPSPTPSIVRRKWSMDSSTDDRMEFALKDVEMEEMTNNSLLVKMERDLAPDNFLRVSLCDALILGDLRYNDTYNNGNVLF